VETVAAAPFAVELREATRRFGARAGRVVGVERVSVVVERGEFFTVLGPSGCGKSTLLRLVNGIERPDEGRVLLGGRDVTDLPPYRRDVHTVFQDYALFPHLDVAGNVEFSLKLKAVRRAERRRRVGEVLEVVGLPGFERKPVDRLSGGERQRVAIARAIVDRPPLLLLDEPLSALDLKLRRRMADFLLELKDEFGLTLIYVTHDQEEAFELSTRIAVMRGGRVLQVGTPRELYDHPATTFVAAFLGEVNLLEGGKVGVRPEHVRVARANGAVPAGAGLDGFRRPGRVSRVRFSGATTQVLVELEGGERVRAVQPNRRRADEGDERALEPGEPVVVGWSPESQIPLDGVRE